ncbi:DUF7288 family protein [Haloarcula amylovorans]|uniref:DUF7288 family protein n=1 Tax=Haloarcula amylovorans TaxID=2562280 RepID=UPI00107685D1|nr:hypothetical protein [Halomicroarcula amylolytica]
MVSGDRGQAYTLEGVLAAILIVSATVYGLQAIDTRAWEDGTRQETRQLSQRANDLLTVASETGALRNATLCYSAGKTRLNGKQETKPARFERMLNQTFDAQGDQYNLYFSYWNVTSDERETQIVSERSEETLNRPPASATVATTTVTLTDTMAIRINGPGPDGCTETGPSLEEDISTYYLQDVDEQAELYNVVEVRLTVW